MGLFTIDRTINFEEVKVKKVLEIINTCNDDNSIEDLMISQGIVNLREGTDQHGFFRRRWTTFLKDFELYNYPYITEIGKLYMNSLISTKEVILLLLVKRTALVNDNTVRPFEVILSVIEKLKENGLEAHISQEEFEKIVSHYLYEGYISLEEIVGKINKKRTNDVSYTDLEPLKPCHFDIWRNLIISSGLGKANTRNIELNLDMPMIKFIEDYYKNTISKKDKDYDFNDSFIKFIDFPSLVETNGEIKFVRTAFKDNYPSIIYNYLFRMSINKIEQEVLKIDEHGNVPHKILNSLNISTNLSDKIRNIRLYSPFIGYEGIIINKLRNSNNKTYKFIADSISIYLLTDSKEEKDKIEELEIFDPIVYDKYDKNDFLNEVFIDENKYETIVSILNKKQNIILEGAPGVGKTYMAKRLAFSLIGSKDIEKIKFIQFHQNYSYEDFIEGFKPNETGFELKKGLFYNFCKRAEKDSENKYYLIIDEINRGNLSKIFGELLMLIESDKRGEEVTLAYSEEQFIVPKNLYIIGLMNTADRSLALIDYALRRRFSFIRIEPAFENEKFKEEFSKKFDEDFSNIIKIIQDINSAINEDRSLGPGFKIGHSYFCPNLKDRLGNKKDIQDIVTYEIVPLLEEYWYDDEDSLIKWGKILDGVIND